MSPARNPLYTLGQLKKIIEKYETAGINPDEVAFNVYIESDDECYFGPEIKQYQDQHDHYFCLEVHNKQK